MTQPSVPEVPPGTLEVIPLGGLGEFGMNMMAVSWHDATILIDAGVMFPDPDQLGVDLIIPDLSYVEARRDNILALLLTHGHEDHIGAVPHVMPLFDGPVYATPLTLALVEPKLEEHRIDAGSRLKPVRPRDVITIGPFSVEFIRVTHSMPDCVALAITTPAGVVIHTGDFKIDQTPIDGQACDLHRFAELGSRGVLALFSDSTNIDRRGFTGPETDVIEGFEEVFTSAHGKLVVAMFSSSIYRMQVLVDLAAQFESQGRLRGPEHRPELRDRPAPRLSAHPVRGADPRRRRAEPSVGGCALPGHRLAGRAAGGALAHCHRRSPLCEARTGRYGGALGACHSGERESHRPHPQPRRPPRRGRGDVRHEAGARVGSWIG
jgi:hypothetical protein